MLASCGVGLQVFVASGQFPRRLRAGEARWLADAEPPDGYSLPEEIPCKRVCVYESQTNTQRFELAQTQTPLLAITCDEHSVNLSALQFLAHKLNCRVVTLRDQAHRCWNDFKGAVQDSSLWPCVNELMHCMNCRHGPWTSQAWFRQTKEALGLHTKKFGPGCPIFQALKDKLVFDMDSATSCEPGSLEEQELVFHKVSETVGAGVKGTRVNLTRWFEFISAYEDFQKEYHIHLYEYCLVLYHSGKLTCLADFPIWEAHQSSCGVEEPAEGQDQRGAEAEHATDIKRDEGNGAQDRCCEFLAHGRHDLRSGRTISERKIAAQRREGGSQSFSERAGRRIRDRSDILTTC